MSILAMPLYCNVINDVSYGRSVNAESQTLTSFSVFDDEDENKLSYTDIHLQYKTLVSPVFGPDVPIIPYHYSVLFFFIIAYSSNLSDVT